MLSIPQVVAANFLMSATLLDNPFRVRRGMGQIPTDMSVFSILAPSRSIFLVPSFFANLLTLSLS